MNEQNRGALLEYLKGRTNARWSVIRSAQTEELVALIKRCGAWENFTKWLDVYERKQAAERQRRDEEMARQMKAVHEMAAQMKGERK